ncbi:transaminase [Jatrophihabitans telluris]|uniref:Transaminase n=1 Tax=Jatrophihabitans telluris TaxID=2038343 RepID=A0ABY4R588_9ACTN|nr:transaminase [Jatrophihabitans telluris]UQX90156.1 transaminase [Jatrophihabitans telluris]
MLRSDGYSSAALASRLTDLIDTERTAYAQARPRSQALFASAEHLFGRVPMTWMTKWSGGFPLYLDRAEGARVTDIDGHSYADFALGDTGAMAGHSPAPVAEAIRARAIDKGGITAMLPTEDAEWVAGELSRRFGLPLWSFTLSATDANRWAIRLARLVTGRRKILVFSYSYHGSVDETFVILDEDGRAQSRPGNVGPAVDPTETTRVAQFNDLASVEAALAHGDVAVIVTEPALTNIGIVLPEPGFLDGVADLARRYGSLLLIDETHTFSAGPSGMTGTEGLQPDIFVIGKSIGGGIPCGAYGISNDIAERVSALAASGTADIDDVGGVGGTLAGNALSTAAMRATLGEVLTATNFDRMTALATTFTEGMREIFARHRLPWTIQQLGARAEFRYASPAPRTGNESAAVADAGLDEYFHLYLANRGVLITPFHNMSLMCPATRAEDVHGHLGVFEDAVTQLLA